MARRLLDIPDQAQLLVENYPACLVTTAEHSALGRTGKWGWRRYVAAQLKVINAETGEPAPLEEMDLRLRSVYEEAGFFQLPPAAEVAGGFFAHPRPTGGSDGQRE